MVSQNNTLTDFLKSKGFTVNVYTLQTPPNEQIIVIFWVDDLILASSDITLIEATKQDLNTRFKMDDRGELRWFLDVDFKQLPDGHYVMSQERYTDSILHCLRMSNCNSMNTPAEKGLLLTEATDDEHQKVHSFPYRSAVGSLIYLMVGT